MKLHLRSQLHTGPHGVYKKAQFVTMATEMQVNNMPRLIFVRKFSYINEIEAIRRTDNGIKLFSDVISLLSARVLCDSTLADSKSVHALPQIDSRCSVCLWGACGLNRSAHLNTLYRSMQMAAFNC